jgi:hypothetical protein
MLNEFPSGISPKTDGGFVVFPVSLLDEGARSPISLRGKRSSRIRAAISMVDPVPSLASISLERFSNVPVTLDSSDVGQFIDRLPHCGG